MAHQYLTAIQRVRAHRSGCRWQNVDDVCDDFLREGTSPSLRAAIEEATQGQRENPVWHLMQKGIVMASDFHEVMERWKLVRYAGAKQFYATKPIMERKVKIQSIAAKKWKVAQQTEALHKYWEKRVAKTRSSLPTELKRTGIIMSPSHPLIGASPQAIVYTKHNPRPVCVVLVKGSYQDRNRRPKEVEQEVVERAPNSRMCIPRYHPWFYEAQATMGVVGVRFCDVVMATNKGIRIKRVFADRGFYTSLEDTVYEVAKRDIYTYLFIEAVLSDGPSTSDYNSTSESESDETSEYCEKSVDTK